MAVAFTRGRDGAVHAQFQPNERALLRVLAEQLAEIVGPQTSPSTGAKVPLDEFDALVAQLESHAHRPPGDPVYERLFPRVHRDDDEVADEFDRAALESLRSGRAARTAIFMQHLKGSGSDVSLTVEDAHLWLTVLTDLRLMIGTTINLVDEDPRRSSPNDASVAGQVSEHEGVYLSVYEWLSWLQEGLVACFLRP